MVLASVNGTGGMTQWSLAMSPDEALQMDGRSSPQAVDPARRVGPLPRHGTATVAFCR